MSFIHIRITMVVVNCTACVAIAALDWRLLTFGPSDYHPTFTFVCTRNLYYLTCPPTSSDYLFTSKLSRLWSPENQDVQISWCGNQSVMSWGDESCLIFENEQDASIPSTGGGAEALMPQSFVVSFCSTWNCQECWNIEAIKQTHTDKKTTKKRIRQQ